MDCEGKGVRCMTKKTYGVSLAEKKLPDMTTIERRRNGES